MAATVYVLCALTSLVCATLLIRGYRARPTRLLFWSSLCFFCLTLNNILLVIDLSVIQSIDFSIPRVVTMATGVGLLIYGLVWDVV